MMIEDRTISCPISWCRGSLEGHGGDGASPDLWFHDEAPHKRMPHGAALGRHQDGASPVRAGLTLDTEEFADCSPSELVQKLRTLTAAVAATLSDWRLLADD